MDNNVAIFMYANQVQSFEEMAKLPKTICSKELL